MRQCFPMSPAWRTLSGLREYVLEEGCLLLFTWTLVFKTIVCFVHYISIQYNMKNLLSVFFCATPAAIFLALFAPSIFTCNHHTPFFFFFKQLYCGISCKCSESQGIRTKLQANQIWIDYQNNFVISLYFVFFQNKGKVP